MKKDAPLLDHNYDGIQELDNPLPRWWLWSFYLAIIFSVIYYAYFHVMGGKSLTEEFASNLDAVQIGKGKAEEVNAFANLDAQNLLKDKSALATGKAVFQMRCVACHGPEGQGLVGPNLTDNYWLHGQGNISDIARVVNDGVPEKGMLAWKTQLDVKEIVAVSVFVRSLMDSHPANPKAPQGTLYEGKKN